MASRTLNFTDHRRALHTNRYVYAVVSRRSRGLSIGINLNPDKACNFACPYCQVDRTVPGGERRIDTALLGVELAEILSHVQDGTLWDRAPFDTTAPAMRVVRDVAIAGDGEPTACPQFSESIDVIAAVCRNAGLRFDGDREIRFNLLTNATLFHRSKVRLGLERFSAAGGEIWAKLDAGTQDYFELVDGTRLSLDRVVANITESARTRPLLIQSLFMRWDNVDPTDAECDAWAGRLAGILDAGGQIRMVQVYTLARRPADARASIVPTAVLERIADRARNLGLCVQLSPGVSQED